jgi:hypothetical protein
MCFLRNLLASRRGVRYKEQAAIGRFKRLGERQWTI